MLVIDSHYKSTVICSANFVLTAELREVLLFLESDNKCNKELSFLTRGADHLFVFGIKDTFADKTLRPCFQSMFDRLLRTIYEMSIQNLLFTSNYIHEIINLSLRIKNYQQTFLPLLQTLRG